MIPEITAQRAPGASSWKRAPPRAVTTVVTPGRARDAGRGAEDGGHGIGAPGAGRGRSRRYWSYSRRVSGSDRTR